MSYSNTVAAVPDCIARLFNFALVGIFPPDVPDLQSPRLLRDLLLGNDIASRNCDVVVLCPSHHWVL